MARPQKVQKQPRFPEIRGWLRRTGTSQCELAALLGVSPAQISRVLGGSRELGTDLAMRMALVTDIPVEKLLGDARAVRLLRLLAGPQGRKRANQSAGW